MDGSSGSERVIAALDELALEHRIVRTVPASSADESAELQGIALQQLLKTIVVRKGDGEHVFVLVPGDREIDWKKLRKQLGVSRASLPAREEAERLTGYRIGTINPFGSETHMPVVVDERALRETTVALGAGERGVNVHLNPSELVERLSATAVDITAPARTR